MREELTEMMAAFKKTLNAAADLIILNLLLILCCIPVVTAGAAWVAAYTHILRILRGVETNLPIRSFFRDFRDALRKATPAWLLTLLCFVILAGDYYYAVYVADPVNHFFMVFAMVMAVVLFAGAIWLYPLLARFENTLKVTIKNAFLMAVAMLPKTLLAMLIQLTMLLILFLYPAIFVYFGWLWMLVGISLPMYITAYLLRKPLDCIPKPDTDIEQD